jgi:hypothetical protein
MKLSDDDKERIDEMLDGLDAAGKAYAMDCLKSKAVDRNDPEEKAESPTEQEAEGHIPLDKDKMFEDEMHDNPEHKKKSGKGNPFAKKKSEDTDEEFDEYA